MLTDRRKKFELIIGLVLFLVLSGIFFSRGFESLELLSLDWRFQLRGPKPFPSEVALIYIDEVSLDIYGRWPWSREKHSNLLRLLSYDFSKPAVLAYDVLFEYRNEFRPQDDADLIRWSKAIGQDLVMSYFFEWGRVYPYEQDAAKEKRLRDFAISVSGHDPKRILAADKLSLPFHALADVTSLGFVNAFVDPDGRTRKVPLLIRYEGRVYPSLALVTMMRYLGVNARDVTLEGKRILIRKNGVILRQIPVSDKGEMLVHYFGKADNIRHISFAQALKWGADWQNGEVLSEELQGLKDKIVLVGVSALGLPQDRKVTPFFESDPGVSVQAQAVANILKGSYLVRAPRSYANLAFFIVALVTIFTTMFLRISRSLPVILGLGVLYFAGCHIFFLAGYWVELAAVEISIALIFTGITCFRYFTALEELKRTQEQLIHSVKMASLGQLSSGIAHEFRNILNAVNLHVEFASRPEVPPERIRHGLEKIKEIMAHANRVLTGLLTFARKKQSVKVPGNLKKTIEETVILVEKEMVRHGIILKTELEDIPEVSYDSGQISQVIMNLINNGRDALKDREAEKEIILRLKNLPDRIRLDIADNGCGIPKDVMKRLFEPFVTSKEAGKGTGLGLSVCHGIIRNHGGDIKVTTAKGKGTTWHIFLPK